MNTQLKPLQDLTLLDRFLFSEAMDDPRFAEDVFSIIMEDDRTLQGLPQTEKEQRNQLQQTEFGPHYHDCTI